MHEVKGCRFLFFYEFSWHGREDVTNFGDPRVQSRHTTTSNRRLSQLPLLQRTVSKN